LTRGFARGDDADDFNVVFFERRVRDEEELSANLPDCPPAYLSMLILFRAFAYEGIFEDQFGKLEIDPVFP